MPERLRIAVIGWGAIARRVAELITEQGLPVEIAAVGLRDTGAVRPGLDPAIRKLSRPEELGGLGLDLVVEAAGRAAVEPWGIAALAEADYAVSSTSAFVDDALLARLEAAARMGGHQILIPPGALAGVDGLAAAATLGLDEVSHTIVKPPAAWRGTAAEQALDLDRVGEAVTFFEGSAREAADRYPQNANVAVIVALAGIGLDRTRLRLAADPQAARNGHRIEASGDFGRLLIDIENRPLATNPKSSEMTALNLLRLLKNRVAAVVS